MTGAIRRVAAVACDPGGINALVPVVRALEDGGAVAWIGTSGPGGDVWDAATLRTIPVRLADDLEADMAEQRLREVRPDLLVSGAGVFNRLEHTFRLAARRLSLPCVAVLDDRSSYRERFGRSDPHGWTPSTPDRICVMDEGTRDEMIARGWDPALVRVTGQPHLEEVERFFGRLSREEIQRRRSDVGVAPGERVIAFFSEPLAEALGGGLTLTAQLQALSHLADALLQMPRHPAGTLHLVVKPHPREDREPLRWTVKVLCNRGLRVRMEEGGGALDLVGLSDVVVGILSMVLFEARLAGRPVVSVQIGHQRTARWWGGADPSIRVATTRDDFRELLADALAEGPAAPSRSRFQGATVAVLRVLEDFLHERGVSRTIPAAPAGVAPPGVREA